MKLTRSGKMMGLFNERGNYPSVSTVLRYNEYYNMQETFDNLYERSKANATKTINLYDIIISKQNILLAYRTIKNNTGSKTVGVDGLTINNYKIMDEEVFINDIKNYLSDYKPDMVRRVMIPKNNGELRPLGIPTMRDRIIQQMFKQVLEPICEAKFHNHSYGFRTNRSTKHALARCQYLINSSKYHYVVDIDIKGFFDNVNHGKLMKQIFNIGVKDSRVLAIISKMLKAPIDGEGIPTKGTPQGGILSPLLSNIVLNDLDWWVSNQYETFKTDKEFPFDSGRYTAIRKSKLKNMFIVRYADDFKIFTNNHKDAIKIYHAVKGYLKNNLGLDISSEKSKITNLRRRKSEFLGFEFKAVKKKNKFVANSHVSSKNIEKIVKTIKLKSKIIKKNPSRKSIMLYNSYVLGIMNYYRHATHVNKDFSIIAFRLARTLYNRLNKISRYELPINPSETYKLLFKNRYKTYLLKEMHLYPLADIKTVNAMNFSQEISNYTKVGRKYLTKKLEDNILKQIYNMGNMFEGNKSIEYLDNRISKYSMQKGKCSVTGKFLIANDVHCHHIIPRYLGGCDEFNNLTVVHEYVHKLIHATKKQTINKYMSILKLDGKQLKKLNNLRKSCNLAEII